MSVEPCGGLPVTHVTVSAHYCHTHMAWTTNAGTHTDDAAGTLTEIHSEHRTWGPFDSAWDVLSWMTSRIEVVTNLPT
jgi:hypothetical protein